MGMCLRKEGRKMRGEEGRGREQRGGEERKGRVTFYKPS